MKPIEVLRLMLVFLSVPLLARQTRQHPAPQSTAAPTTTPMPRPSSSSSSSRPVESECSQRTTWITDPQLAARFPWVTSRADCQRGQQEKRPPPQQVVERPASGGGGGGAPNISARLDPNRGTFFVTAVTSGDLKQQQQVADRHEFRQQLVAGERRRAAEMGRPASVEELVGGQVQPAKWLDACNRMAVAQPRPITLFIGPQSHQPMRIIEQERKHSDLFLRQYRHRLNESTIAVVTQPDQAEQPHKTDTTTNESNHRRRRRRRRSIVDQRQLTLSSLSDLTTTKQQTAKYFKAKKTTFRMNNKSLKKAKLGGRGGAPKNLYLYSPMDSHIDLSASTTSPTTTTTTTSTTTTTISPAQMELNARARKAVERVFGADINVSWAITRTLHSLNNSRQVADRLAALARPQADRLRGSARADQLERQRTSWLPPMDSLVEVPVGATGNWSSVFSSSGLYDVRTRELLVNVSQYIEFFVVAFEQITFEHHQDKSRSEANQTVESNPAEHAIYGQLESSSLAVLCETEQLLELLDAYRRSRLELEPMIPSIRPGDLDDLAAYYERTILAKGKRESKLAATFKSPLRLAYDNSRLQDRPSSDAPADSEQHQQQANLDPLRPPEHVWRRVMPMEQRKLSQANGERALRDESILKDYNKLLTSYDNLLMHNYI